MSRLLLEQLSDADLPVQFGRYELQAVLGEGGMARVFRAELHGPAGFRKQVALKVIKAATTAQTKRNDIRDLVHEACLGGRLKHPNLVDVYELGEVDGQLFIAMELVDGLALNRLIRMGWSIPPSVVLEIAIAITSGLTKVHGLVGDDGAVGLVHRDLKPHNILISYDGAIKVADFGGAIMRRSASTMDGSVVRDVYGTPSYMSPEQVRGQSVDARSDLFSFALVMATMVLGANPLAGKVVLNRIQAGEPLVAPLLSEEDMHEIDEAIPGLTAVILRCLEPDRALRTSRADHLMTDLRTLQDRTGHTPRLTEWIATVMGGNPPRILEQETMRFAGDPAAADRFDQLKTVVFASSSAARTNLGPQLDDYVGRVAELTELSRTFDGGARLVTLKGTGGAGKTRLSARYARTQVDALEGGAWFVDLTESRSERGIIAAVARALEIPLGGGDPQGLIKHIGHAFAGRGPVLLVLDNFEQIVECSASTIGVWQRMAPEARFLVTSREPLRLPGEQVHVLNPMSESEGSVLFELRARAAGATWLETEEMREAITHIVQRLDGLPLAIELAAARANSMTPAQIRDRLNRRFDLLRRGRRDQAERQASLRALIDWSWELLEPWERATLAQLSVFRDGFSLEAAEEVVDLSRWPEAPWSLDVVASLMDKSLLFTREVRGRHRGAMYVSIQEYAAEKIGADAPKTRLRHARHFALFGSSEYLASTNTHGGVERFRALIVELENILAGMSAALDAGDLDAAAACGMAAAEVFQMHGPTLPGVELVQNLLNEPIEPIMRARLLKVGAQLHQHASDLDEADRYYTEALRIVQQHKSVRLEGHIESRIGWLAMLRGRSEESHAHFTRALQLHRDANDRIAEGETLGRIGWLWYRQGRLEEASAYYPKALAIHREQGNRKAEGVQIGNWALMLCQQGDVVRALEYFQRSMAIHREIGNRRAESDGMSNIGILHAQQGRNSEAQTHYRRALRISRLVGNLRGQARIVGNIANLLSESGEFGQAKEHYEQALVIHENLDDPRGLGELLGNYGDLLLSQGDLKGAEKRLRRAIELSQGIQPLCVGVFSASLAHVCALNGAVDEALSLMDQAEPLVRDVHQAEWGKLLCKKAIVHGIAGDRVATKQAITKARSIAENLAMGEESDLMRAIEATVSALQSIV